MIDYRELSIGDKLVWLVDDFDCVKPLKQLVVVTDINKDRAIAELSEDRSVHLWIDDDTAIDFHEA